MPPKPAANVIKWAQRIFGKLSKLHRMGPLVLREVPSIILDGPRHAAKTVDDVNKWAQRFLESFAGYIEWAQTRHQNPLLMLLNGPSVFREVLQTTSDGPRHAAKTVADVNKWAQRFLGSSENYIG